MKAHALTCRMLDDVQFPYLVLLISGGHCLLAVAKTIDLFELLGTTIDDAPGEAFDKVKMLIYKTNCCDWYFISLNSYFRLHGD